MEQVPKHLSCFLDVLVKYRSAASNSLASCILKAVFFLRQSKCRYRYKNKYIIPSLVALAITLRNSEDIGMVKKQGH